MPDSKKKRDLFEKWVEAGVVDSKLALVQSFSMQGQSMGQIADFLEITRKTLQNLQNKHPALKKAIENGRQTVVAMCQNKLMEKVNNGDTTAIIYALKVYGGEFFNDRKLPDVKGSGAGASVQPQVQIYLPAVDSEAGDHDAKKE
ncbi:MAG: hypothetical protein IJ741_03600 [Schwartzia sp.]|nr:hypothetical protein [Schwartzia sp. (in: firmicutes)]